MEPIVPTGLLCVITCGELVIAVGIIDVWINKGCEYVEAATVFVYRLGITELGVLVTMGEALDIATG